VLESGLGGVAREQGPDAAGGVGLLPAGFEEERRASCLLGVDVEGERLFEADAYMSVGAAFLNGTPTLLANICCVLNPSWIVLDGEAPDHEPSTAVDETSVRNGHNDPRPCVAAVCHAINRNAMPQVRQDEHLQIKTVKDLVTEEGRHLIPQLLGALALVVDHLGDGFLMTPIKRWINDPKARELPPSFT